MMKRLPALLILSILLVAISLGRSKNGSEEPAKATQVFSPPERIGEEIIYEVRYRRLSIGEAKFSYKGKFRLDGRLLRHIIFTTRVLNFSDVENIYVEPESFLPVRIERDIASFMKKEQISEEYDQKNYRVKITKRVGRRSQEQVIQSKGVIHNAIVFPYAVRDLPDLEIGRVFKVNLPSRTLDIRLVGIEELSLPKGVFQAFRFESTPKQISVWISTDERRIPVKIEGAGVFGYTLLLKEYRI